jgi:hypothetical protein
VGNESNRTDRSQFIPSNCAFWIGRRAKRHWPSFIVVVNAILRFQ